MRRFFWLSLLAVALSARGGEGPSIFSDDFENASRQSPPPGWTMWGDPKFKVAADFIRDPGCAHSGAASFRIQHPKDTRGYIVLSPDRAILPKPAMIYTVSFWARADEPGKALFQWTAYKSIGPFEDAPSPGAHNFDVGGEWKEFTYSMREGIDLFADESRFLLLTFHAATKSKEERTLWIDDVRVTERPDPYPVRLVNDSVLPHEALSHRLRPGDRLEFTLNPTERLGRATREVGGVSFHRVCGWTGQPYNKKGEFTLAPELESAVREMQLPMTRFYAVGVEPFGVEASLDKLVEVLRRVGVEQERCVVEFEEQGARAKLSPEEWARGVEYSLRRGYRFHHWEIANEPYSSMWGEGGAFPTPESFVDHFRAVARAIRKVDPKAQLGVDICRDNVRWGNFLLKELAGDYDFVAPHYYCGADLHRLPFEEIVLTENYRMLDRALRINALLRTYNPQRETYQYDTEWGMICRAPDGKEADYEGRNANIIGTLHRAVRLIYYAREGMLRGASSWQMLNRLDAPGFGILAQEAPDKRFMLYWLYYYFNRHVGEWALAMDGVAPFSEPTRQTDRVQFSGPLTPVLATLSKDGLDMDLMIANGSWTRAVPCRVRLKNFAAKRATGVLLTSNDPNGSPLLERKEDFVSDFPVQMDAAVLTCEIPPHSVVFVTLSGK